MNHSSYGRLLLKKVTIKVFALDIFTDLGNSMNNQTIQTIDYDSDFSENHKNDIGSILPVISNYIFTRS